VIIIIGENRTFDHVFGTYVPRTGQTISNLLSKGIVKLDGTPGPNFALSAQYSAFDNQSFEGGAFTNSPMTKTLYKNLPPSLTGGAPTAGTVYGFPFLSQIVGEIADQGLSPDYNQYLTTGATGLPSGAVDTRIENAAAPADGVYQLTGPKMPYDACTSSPVHRLFQMWQETDCNIRWASDDNPSGCLKDLFPLK
jgi:phospholipase C